MRVGVVTSAFHGLDLERALGHCRRLGLERIELTAGGFFPKRICDPAALLADADALRRYRERLDEAGLVVSALAVHGQPLHPDEAVAAAYLADFEAACRVAREFGTDRLTLLAGLRAARPGDRFPNWIVHPYPDENREALLALGPAIYHAHAKDVRLNVDVARREGVLDPKAHGDHRRRSWFFRTVGYGHDEGWWRELVSTLRAVGYDDTLSIEHEAPLLDPLERAVRFLREIVPERPAAGLWYE